jgi:hypothetical protein
LIPDITILAAHGDSHTASAKTVIPLMLTHIAVGSLWLLVLPTLGAEARDKVAVPGRLLSAAGSP